MDDIAERRGFDEKNVDQGVLTTIIYRSLTLTAITMTARGPS
jgi:hypothetical protein